MIMVRWIVEAEGLADLEFDDLVPHLAPAIQRLLVEPLPA
jgi:hypothetical protein